MKKILTVLLMAFIFSTMMTFLSKKSNSDMTVKLNINCKKSIYGVIQRIERHKGFVKVYTINDSVYFGFDEFRPNNHALDFISSSNVGDTIVKNINSDTICIYGNEENKWLIYCPRSQ
jgi:hypothetical protein